MSTLTGMCIKWRKIFKKNDTPSIKISSFKDWDEIRKLSKIISITDLGLFGSVKITGLFLIIVAAEMTK